MRLTYAIYVELNIDAQLPGFWEGIAQFEFCQGLDRADFRIRQEIARIEVEHVTEKNRGKGQQVVERAAKRLLVPALRRLLDSPELDAVVAASIAHLDICEVESAPNPKQTHGLEGEKTNLACPVCAGPMVRRQGKGRWPFWGCANYPACKGTRSMSR